MKNKKRKGEFCYLSELVVKERAVVERIDIEGFTLRRRLIEMGIIKGVFVEIKKIAPLGDPFSVVVRGFELCIRKSELKKIFVRVV